MAVSPEFINYLEDLFSNVPDATIRKMFGGIGVFRHGLMFAVGQDDGRIAFKADEQTIPKYEQEGCTVWVYENKKSGKKVSMGYWYIPEFILDDPEAFETWAQEAFDSAARIDFKKPASQRKLKT